MQGRHDAQAVVDAAWSAPGRRIRAPPAGAGASSTRPTRAGDVQRDLLLERIARHADSQFGRDHHFREIRTPADFRRRVPIGGYDRHEPYIDRVRQGDTERPVRPGHRGPDVRHDLGHDQPAQDDPRHRASRSRDYREGWTIWGILAFDAHLEILAQRASSRSSSSPATGARASRPPASPAARSPG